MASASPQSAVTLPSTGTKIRLNTMRPPSLSLHRDRDRSGRIERTHLRRPFGLSALRPFGTSAAPTEAVKRSF
jgi:hypothetical protein